MESEVFIKVCNDLEETHLGLIEICRRNKTSRTSFNRWLKESDENWNTYTRARELQLDYLEELLRETAFNESKDSEVDFKVNIGANHIQRDRLKVDTLKFILGKLRNKKWGDKLDVTSNGEKINAIEIAIIRPDED
jgi:hypothetical protein